MEGKQEESQGDVQTVPRQLNERTLVEQVVSDAPSSLKDKFRIRNVMSGREAYKFILTQSNCDILRDILKNVNTRTLLTLKRLSEPLKALVSAPRFWMNIKLDSDPLTLQMIEEALEHSHGRTRSVQLRSPISALREFDFLHFTKILGDSLNRCIDLSVLELEGVAIDLREVKLTIFPKSLRRLTLNCCNVCKLNSQNPILFGMDSQLTNLEELAIQNNDWLEPENMEILSKIPKLRWLSLKSCQNIYAIPNFLTVWSGFQKLEYLDLRLTPVHELDMGCFNVVKTLKELHLEYPAESLYGTVTQTPGCYENIDGTCRGLITDDFFCRFGIEEIDDDQPVKNHFERLSVRGYGLISNVTLKHLAEFSQNLKFLDLSGTDVTTDGVLRFKEDRPDCEVFVEHMEVELPPGTSIEGDVE